MNSTIIQQRWERDDLIENVRFLIDAGLRYDEIAVRLKISRESLQRKFMRMNIWIPEKRALPAVNYLNKLMATGLPFSAFDFPQRFDDEVILSILGAAQRMGQIKVVGETKNIGKFTANLYTSA